MSRFFDNEVKRQMSKIIKEVQKELADEKSKTEIVKEALKKGTPTEKIMRKHKVSEKFVNFMKAELGPDNHH